MNMSLSVYQGESRSISYTLYEEDSTNTLDLTAANVENVYLIVSRRYNDQTVIKKTGTNLTSDGGVDFTLTGTDTDIKSRNYHYQIVVDYTDDEYYADTGTFFVRKIVGEHE